jgi:hypothetical protein
MCSSGKGHEFSLFGWGLAGLTLDAQNIAILRFVFVCVVVCSCTSKRVCNTDSVCVCSLNGWARRIGTLCIKQKSLNTEGSVFVELARTISIRYIYGIFGRETTIYTVIYGVYIRFWPTLRICQVQGVCLLASGLLRERANY